MPVYFGSVRVPYSSITSRLLQYVLGANQQYSHIRSWVTTGGSAPLVYRERCHDSSVLMS